MKESSLKDEREAQTVLNIISDYFNNVKYSVFKLKILYVNCDNFPKEICNECFLNNESIF